MLFLILTMPVYTAFSLSITNVAIQTTQTTASVTFQTDAEADSQFLYTVEGRQQTTNSGFEQTLHSRAISGLAPGVEYPYVIQAQSTNGSGETTSETGTFTTQGAARSNSTSSTSPTSTTSGGSSTGGLTPNADDRVPPTVTLGNVPSETSQSDITVTGSVNENVNIGVFVRYERTGTEYEQGVLAYPAGNFSIVVPLDEGDNTVLLEINDSGGNLVYRTAEIYVDTEPPQILEHNLDELSPAYTSVVEITGRVSEPNIPIRIYIDENKASFASCSDGKDNDGDGRIDYLNDPGCASPDDVSEIDSTTASACNDGIDNDGDGKIDFLRDPGCDSQTDNSEVDFESEVTECNDGIDNDNDGEIDFLRDDGCSSLADDSENSDQSNDFEQTRADANGYFSKEISLLGGTFSLFEQFGGANIPDVRTSVESNTFNDQQRFGNEQGFGASYTTVGRHDIRIVATDRVGQFDEVKGVIEQVSCSQGGGNWIISIGDVYPVSIQPDHVFNGIAQVTFNVDVDYVGPGNQESARINYATVRQQQRSIADRKELSPEDILTGSRCKFYPSGEFSRSAHVVCPLNKWPSNAQQNLTNAYELLEGYESLTFPLQLEFAYQYREGNSQNGTIVSDTQKECVDLEIFVDKRFSPDNIPSELLNTSVEVLDAVIDGIDGVLQPLNTVKLGTMAACFATSAMGIFQGAGEVSACLADGASGKVDALEQLIRGAQGGDYDTSVVCGEDDCDNCASAIAARIQSEQFRQQLCDRIFCPAIPTATEYIKQVNEKPNLAKASACSQTGPYNGKNTKVTDVNTLLVNYEGDEFNAQEGCGKEYNDKWGTACLLNTNVVKESKDLLKPQDINPDRAPSFGDFVNKIGQCKGNPDNEKKDVFRSGGSVFVKQQQTLRNGDVHECYTPGIDTGEANFVAGSNQIDETTGVSEVNAAALPTDKLNAQKLSTCVETLPNGRLAYKFRDNNGDLVEYNPNDFKNTEFITVDGRTGKETVQITKYARNDLPPGAEVAAGTPEKFIGKDSEGNYYTGVSGEGGAVTWEPRSVTEKGNYGLVQQSPNQQIGTQAQGYDVTDDPNAPNTLTGPQQLKQQSVRAILKDPTASFIRSVQCVCLPAIEGYLTVIRNVLEAIKNCFQSVLITGEFQAGTCRALLTQYLCDWIYQAIKCVLQASELIAGTGAQGIEGEDGGTVQPRGGVFSSLSQLSQGSKKLTNSMTQRYGDTSTFNALFNQRKLLHAVCLAAFGYDWLPELDLATSIQGGGFSINSTAFVAPATRRFISANPLEGGQATFIYHVGYFISAGSDLNYRVELVCSQDTSCSASEGFEGGRCDCSYSRNAASGSIGSGSEVTRLVDSGSVRGGDVVGSNSQNPTDSTGDKYISVSEPVRYDKVRMTWFDTSVGRNENANGITTSQPKNGQIITEIKTIGQRYPPTCTFNLIAFRFACDYLAYGASGDVFFIDPKITLGVPNGQTNFKITDNFALTVHARQDMTGVPIEDQIGKFARVTLKKKSTGAVLYERETGSNSFDKFLEGDGAIPIITPYIFGNGDQSRNANDGYAYLSGSKGVLGGGSDFLGSARMVDQNGQPHIEQTSTRFYLRVSNKGASCDYQTEPLTVPRVPASARPNTGWNTACEIGTVQLLDNNNQQKLTYVATISRNGKNVVIPLIESVVNNIQTSAVGYFDFANPIGTPSSLQNQVCGDPTRGSDTLIAEVTLLHGQLRDPDRPNTPGNVVAGVPSVYQGVLQKQTVEFDVLCQNGATVGLENVGGIPQCAVGTYIRNTQNTIPCTCGALNEVITEQTIAAGTGLYCTGDNLLPICTRGTNPTTCGCLVNSLVQNLCAVGQSCNADGSCSAIAVDGNSGK